MTKAVFTPAEGLTRTGPTFPFGLFSFPQVRTASKRGRIGLKSPTKYLQASGGICELCNCPSTETVSHLSQPGSMGNGTRSSGGRRRADFEDSAPGPSLAAKL
jgi:hypothetical protein